MTGITSRQSRSSNPSAKSQAIPPSSQRQLVPQVRSSYFANGCPLDLISTTAQKISCKQACLKPTQASGLALKVRQGCLKNSLDTFAAQYRWQDSQSSRFPNSMSHCATSLCLRASPNCVLAFGPSRVLEHLLSFLLKGLTSSVLHAAPVLSRAVCLALPSLEPQLFTMLGRSLAYGRSTIYSAV